jgi:type IX secretion system PorP/SprF family membrane protein
VTTLKSVVAQDVTFSQFYRNPIYLNPSLTALQSCGRAYMNYRNAAFGPLLNTSYSLAFDLPIQEAKSGIGGRFMWNEDGLARFGSFGVQFSRKVSIREDIFFTLGIEGGGVFRTWNTSELVLPSDFTNSGTASQINPPSSLTYDFAAGAGFNYRIHFVGFSVRHLTESQAKSVIVNSQLYRKYVYHYGARFKYVRPGQNYGYFAPHLIFEHQKGNNHLSTGVYATYNRVGGGVWIRNNFPFQMSSLIIMGAIKTLNWEFTYSYDIPINGSGIFLGAHEVGISYYLSDFKETRKGVKSKNCLSF